MSRLRTAFATLRLFAAYALLDPTLHIILWAIAIAWLFS